MSSPAIFVQVRYSSSRLPGKALMDIEGESLILRLYHRLKESSLPCFFLTSNDKSDDIIADYFEGHSVPYFRGSLNNVLNRFIEAAKHFEFDKFFRVTGDNPFVDINCIEKEWQHFVSFDYVDNIHNKGSIIGTGFEFVTLKSLESIPSDVSAYHKEHVTTYLRENSDNYSFLRYIPSHGESEGDLYLTCDYLEDFLLIEKIYEHFGYSNYINVNDIVGFLNENPHLKLINQSLHARPVY